MTTESLAREKFGKFDQIAKFHLPNISNQYFNDFILPN